jgi:hypothetical protein
VVSGLLFVVVIEKEEQQQHQKAKPHHVLPSADFLAVLALVVLIWRWILRPKHICTACVTLKEESSSIIQVNTPVLQWQLCAVPSREYFQKYYIIRR